MRYWRRWGIFVRYEGWQSRYCMLTPLILFSLCCFFYLQAKYEANRRKHELPVHKKHVATENNVTNNHIHYHLVWAQGRKDKKYTNRMHFVRDVTLLVSSHLASQPSFWHQKTLWRTSEWSSPSRNLTRFLYKLVAQENYFSARSIFLNHEQLLV